MNREDFSILDTGVIYFDNGATTLKPKVLAEAVSDYYNFYSANAHRGDYQLSLKSSAEYENSREKVRRLINAEDASNIAFTSGTTDSLNKIVFGYFKNYLCAGDEVLITKSEHASNVLPWFELAKEIGIKVKYINLTNDHKVVVSALDDVITDRTKVISIAHVTNVVGDIRPIKDITDFAHKKGILVVCDGAQSVPHLPIDVQDLDVDFFAFSAHKMCGPTGVGVLYGKSYLLNDMKPVVFGGGMNATFNVDGTSEYKDMPDKLEAGTPNIAGVIGFGYVIDYLMGIGFDKIHAYELELKNYLIKRLNEIDNVIIYNENTETGIVAINYNGVFAQDLAIYLDKYNICVRSGNHCAKILKNELDVKNTCRISLYFYNTKDEIDMLIAALKNDNLINEII